jgi:hypothetical protein
VSASLALSKGGSTGPLLSVPLPKALGGTRQRGSLCRVPVGLALGKKGPKQWVPLLVLLLSHCMSLYAECLALDKGSLY